MFAKQKFCRQPRPDSARLLWLWLLFLSFASGARAQEIVTNATAGEVASVKSWISQISENAQKRDVNALGILGATLPVDSAPLRVSTQISHIAAAPTGALVRLNFRVLIERQTPAILSSGTQELWLSRARGGGFVLTDTQFFAPPDALELLIQKAGSEWADASQDEGGETLDLVASRVGGRWIALRSQRWDGELLPGDSRANNEREFLTAQMASAPQGSALGAHFLMQENARGWFGLGAAFETNRRIAPQSDALAASWRERMKGEAFLSAQSHRDFGLALAGVGLWNESYDELQKANLLQPNLVSAAKLGEVAANRARDPQTLVEKQIEQERNVGLGAEHPKYLISALLREQAAQPSAIGSLRLALEYSRLAQDELAQRKVNEAIELQNRGAVRPQDAQWVALLFEHLRERARLSRSKPSQILRSALFTVRVWPGDPGAIDLLAALEEAQHTVYADFGIPMGNTEVLLWRSQDEFARYTTQFTEQGGSEFVAALTLTKLVNTRTGPLVLGEEVNAFVDGRDRSAIFGTVAHEYGHVAVRQLSKGRFVPVWFNEGIATSVEGGYDGYLPRVRRAANNGILLSMREMTKWDVDGERAFLAYSQANSIVDYIVSRWGKSAVLNILRRIGQDENPDAAFRAVLGVSQTELWNRWVQEGIR